MTKASSPPTQTLPIAYVHTTLEQARERGVPAEPLIDGLGIEALLQQADARVSFFVYGRIALRALRMTGDGGMGYEFGLRSGLTSHALVGFGVMNQPTLRDALLFSNKYLGPLRAPGFTSRFFLDADQAVIDVREAVDFGKLHRYALDVALVGLTHLLRPFVDAQDIELWFEYEEPAYFERYRAQLPGARFSMGANQLRFPAARLDHASGSANPFTAEIIERECERQLQVVGPDDRTLSRVRALLSREPQMDVDRVAKRLSVSPRTLKRRLQAHGIGFRELSQEARRDESLRLLHETELSVDEIGRRVGYAAHSGFIRAFRRWTGSTPSNYRGSGPK